MSSRVERLWREAQALLLGLLSHGYYVVPFVTQLEGLGHRVRQLVGPDTAISEDIYAVLGNEGVGRLYEALPRLRRELGGSRLGPEDVPIGSTRFGCHVSHARALKLLDMMRVPATAMRPEDRQHLMAVLSDVDIWFRSDCAEFGHWWASEIFSHLDWAAAGNDQSLLDVLVLTWFELTGYLLRVSGASGWSTEVGRARHAERLLQRRPVSPLTNDEWTRMFISGVAGNAKVAGTLAAHLSTFPELMAFLGLTEARAGLRAIARRSMDEDSLRPRFLSLACSFAQSFPDDGFLLMDDVLRVTGTNPVGLLPYLGRYLLAVPHSSPEASASLMTAHKTVHDWVRMEEERSNVRNVADMRRAQERFVPHLQNRAWRAAHRKGEPGFRARIYASRFGTAQAINGTVLDISAGGGSMGRGVGVLVEGWRLANAQHHGTENVYGCHLHRNSVRAARGDDVETFEFVDPVVELTWGDGRCVRSESVTVRAINQQRDSFCVLFLKGPDDGLSAWREQAERAPVVDYGFSRSGPSLWSRTKSS